MNQSPQTDDEPEAVPEGIVKVQRNLIVISGPPKMYITNEDKSINMEMELSAEVARFLGHRHKAYCWYHIINGNELQLLITGKEPPPQYW